MEWVETTGRTVEEAKDAALDELGVDEADAEFDVLEEPKSGLFGRVRQEARVRARVRPSTPRPKADRRDRRRRGRDRAEETIEPRSGDADRRPGRNGGSDVVVEDEVPAATMEEIGATATAFVDGLLEAFDVDGDIELGRVDDDTLEVQVTGSELGLLIGPKGQTLMAVQELTRTVVQRRHDTYRGVRVNVDVGGYRQRRREALERFTRSVAEDVLANGRSAALEPMAAADRKIVHDTANDIAGVRTMSEGEEPRRRVVLLPDDATNGD